jgi:anti-sigma regulatory factor (Ser/Thr protein kinase)
MGSWQRTFPGELRQLRELRRWIASVLPPRPLRDDVTSVANELASNAICHTRSGQGGEFIVEITRQGRLMRVMVTDGGAPGGPRLVDKPDGDGGRGLVVVNALAMRVGVDGDHHGRAVWADIDWAGDDATAALARRSAEVLSRLPHAGPTSVTAARQESPQGDAARRIWSGMQIR